MWIFWRFFNIFDRVTPMKIVDFLHFSAFFHPQFLQGLPYQNCWKNTQKSTIFIEVTLSKLLKNTKKSIIFIGVTLSKLLKKHQKIHNFHRGYPIKNVWKIYYFTWSVSFIKINQIFSLKKATRTPQSAGGEVRLENTVRP